MNVLINCKYLISSFVIVVFCLQQCCWGQSTTVRPYKFGFTIDEQQHRREMRDERGIVMGEFGFITADGIYHVTVYATDEQGRFRILAMKSYPYESPPKTVEVMVQPKIPPKTTTTTTTAKPLARHNFNTQACSGCFLTNGNNKPKDANGLEGEASKSETNPLSSPGSSSSANPKLASKTPSSEISPFKDFHALKNTVISQQIFTALPSPARTKTIKTPNKNYLPNIRRPVAKTSTLYTNTLTTNHTTHSSTQMKTYAKFNTQTNNIIGKIPSTNYSSQHSKTLYRTSHNTNLTSSTKKGFDQIPTKTFETLKVTSTALKKVNTTQSTDPNQQFQHTKLLNKHTPRLLSNHPYHVAASSLRPAVKKIANIPSFSANLHRTVKDHSAEIKQKPQLKSVETPIQIQKSYNNAQLHAAPSTQHQYTVTTFSKSKHKGTPSMREQSQQIFNNTDNSRINSPHNYSKYDTDLSVQENTKTLLGKTFGKNFNTEPLKQTEPHTFNSTQQTKTISRPSYPPTTNKNSDSPNLNTAPTNRTVHTTHHALSTGENQKKTRPKTQGSSAAVPPSKTPTVNPPPIMDIIMQKVLPALMGKKGQQPASGSTQSTGINNSPNVSSNQKPSSGNNGINSSKNSGTSSSSANSNGDGDLYRFKYILDYHGHTETGKRNGNKEGRYFAIGDDNVERTVEYVANELGYQPRVRWRKLDTNEIMAKENTLKDYEFVWFSQ